MEHEADRAARRTAINLMRLLEALELSETPEAAHLSYWAQRRRNIQNRYKQWFTSQAYRRIP